MQALLDENPILSTSELARELNINRTTVIKHLHDMEDSQRRKMSFTLVIGKCHCEPIEHLHFVDRQTKKEEFFLSNCYWG